MRARCLRLTSATTGEMQTESVWLTVGKVYPVLGILASPRRGVLLQLFSDEDQVPAFFAAEDFELLENSIPSAWVCALNDGVVEFGLPSLLRKGFWEEFFDGSEAARMELERLRVEYFGRDHPN